MLLKTWEGTLPLMALMCPPTLCHRHSCLKCGSYLAWCTWIIDCPHILHSTTLFASDSLVLVKCKPSGPLWHASRKDEYINNDQFLGTLLEDPQEDVSQMVNRDYFTTIIRPYNSSFYNILKNYAVPVLKNIQLLGYLLFLCSRVGFLFSIKKIKEWN